MIPQTRDDFKAFCLRALGDGVLQINVSDDQVEDRIDQAIYLYQQRHIDAIIKVYIQHEITASLMYFQTDASGFNNNEFIVGQTSNTTGTVVQTLPVGFPNTAIAMFTTSLPTPTLYFPPVPGGNTDFGHFLPGETVSGIQSGFSANIALANSTFSPFVLGDMDNRYVSLDPSIIAVTRIFAPFDSRFTADILFDPQSQFNMSLMSNFTSTSIIPYVIGRQYQQLLNDTFRGRPGTRFTRHQGRVYIDVNWYSVFYPGQFLIVDGYQVLDPNEFTLVWSDRWLQDYTTALIKKQWGINLSKYSGITLPGNVQLDGKSMKAEAIEEIKALEAFLDNSNPIDFIVG